MRALYSLGVIFFGISIRIASLFNSKAKLWVRGRKNLFEKLESYFKNNNSKIAWFHCASLGEFEQGRPIIEEFKKRNSDFKILLTFFSPSGYEVRKNFPGADFVCYLPLDTVANAKRFVELINPTIVYFVKYEFWLNFLFEFRKRKIPHFLVSAVFREDQIFFKPYGKIFCDALKGFSFIFTQESKSLDLLNSIGITKSAVAGDTRFDRVADIAINSTAIPIAKSFAGDSQKVIVAGSTWVTDEEKLVPAVKGMLARGWKLLIAPHELGEAHLISIEKELHKIGIQGNEIIRFSNATEQLANTKKVLIVDNIGMLSSLYAYGKIAYIGGGFGKSIHNILEAAVFGMPIIFGPKFEKFIEAKQLISIGAAITVNNEIELKNTLEKFEEDEELRLRLASKAHDYIQNNRGATELIFKNSSLFINH